MDYENSRPSGRGGAAPRLAQLSLLSVLVAPALWAAVPEPSAVIFGVGVQPLPAGAFVEARVGSDQVAAYAIGSLPGTGNSYVLQIPIETPTAVAEPRTPGVARPGDTVELYVNAVSTGTMLTLDQRGQVVELLLDAGGDIFAPFPPTSLMSSSHTADEWSADPTVDVVWSGALDEQGPLAGYSVSNDRAAASDPDSSVDVAQVGDPHQLTIGPFVEAPDHWFHLRSCDVAGNCSATVHLGPFKIDVTPPVAPTDLIRTGPPDASTVEVTWIAPADGGSGVVGYGWDFTRQPTAPCPESVLGSETSATSEPLADGEWYAHVCAVDAVGNWGPVASAGPFDVASSAPQVVSVGTVGPTADGVLDQDELVRVPVTQLALRFSEEMNDPTGDIQPDDVTNPANYLLVAAGADGTVDTVDCAAGPSPQDVAVGVAAVLHEATAVTASLLLDAPRGLAAGRHRLFACGSIGLQDLGGTALDGNGDGTGGDDFALDFEVLSDNLLANPNFDDGVAGWDFVGPATAGLFASVEDVGEASTSGSAEVTGVASGAQAWAIDQCVRIEVGALYQIGGFARVDSGTDQPMAALIVEFHRDPACTTLEQAVFGAAIGGDTRGEFERLDSRPIAPPGTLGSLQAFARVLLDVSTTSSAGFTVLFDSVSLRPLQVVFGDGFESGDTTQWSSTTGAQP